MDITSLPYELLFSLMTVNFLKGQEKNDYFNYERTYYDFGVNSTIVNTYQ